MNLKEANITQISSHIKSGKYEIPIRLYSYEGQIGCSVSTACNVIVPLHLSEYFKKGVYKEIEKNRVETANLGTEAHSLVEQQGKGEEVAPKEELKEWFNEWNKTQKQYDITEEMSEVNVFSKTFAYGGRVDRIGVFDGKRSIIDLKTGRYSHINLWKTEAYRQAYIEMTGDKDIGAVVVHVPRPDLMARGFKVAHYTIDRHETCFLNFLCAYQCFKMYYYKDLMKLGMREKDVFDLSPFSLYERTFGSGINK